jgi:hypothetical protein
MIMAGTSNEITKLIMRDVYSRCNDSGYMRKGKGRPDIFDNESDSYPRIRIRTKMFWIRNSFRFGLVQRSSSTGRLLKVFRRIFCTPGSDAGKAYMKI